MGGGLWLKCDKGFQEYCQNPAPRLHRNVVSSMIDLMPSPRLIFREWDRHGVCSGLPARAYFETIRNARAMVKIPDDLLDLKQPRTVPPGESEDAGTAAKPGFAPAGIAI